MVLEPGDRFFNLYNELDEETKLTPMMVGDFVKEYGVRYVVKAVNEGLQTMKLHAEAQIYRPGDPFDYLELPVDEIEIRRGKMYIISCLDEEEWNIIDDIIDKIKYEYQHDAVLLDVDKPCIKIKLSPNDTIKFRRAQTIDELEETLGEIGSLFH